MNQDGERKEIKARRVLSFLTSNTFGRHCHHRSVGERGWLSDDFEK